jgi:hypothetical protein
MRIRFVGTMLLAIPLAGCCPCAPPDEPEEAPVQKTVIDYYGPPADIVLVPPPVPPEIMGPTPMDRLPKK